MFAKIIQFTGICFGCIFILLGSVGILLGIIAIIDPVGTKMANDGDPFGVPPTISESLTLTLIYVFVFFLGVLLVIGHKQSKHRFSNIKLK